MAYDLPGNMTSSVDLFNYIGSVTDNWFFPGVLVAVFVIILIKMLTNPSNTTAKSFAAASFMVMIISVFARVLDFVSTKFMTLFIIFTAAGAIWMHIENAGS